MELAVLIRTRHLLHQSCSHVNIRYILASFAATNTISSAYSNNDIFLLPMVTSTFKLFILFTKSLIKRENSVGDKLSPCYIPELHENQSVNLPLMRTQDVVLVYKLFIELYILPSIFSKRSLYNNMSLCTKSKAFFKSTNVAKTVYSV